MDMTADHKQISREEKAAINQQVKSDLVEHLYKGCLPGTIGAFPLAAAFFIDFYGHTSTFWLVVWICYFFAALINLGTLYFLHRKYREKLSLNSWLLAYSVSMSWCATGWGLSLLLMPADSVFRQYVAIIALVICANAYAAGTIGVFRLCLVTLTIIMLPLVIWSFAETGPLYKLIGIFSIIYFMFLVSINRRSTEWFKDSMALKLENTLVSYQANHDLLTGLPNQRILPQYIESAIQATKKTQQTFALLCFSLNRMENINDSLGHQVGDIITQTVASRLTEFAAALSKKGETQYVVTISRKDTFNMLVVPFERATEESIKTIFSIVDEPIYLEKQAVKLTASMGVSLYGKDGTDVHTLLMCADSAMLQAKQFGGNRLEFYRSEINEQLPKQVALETDLHDALKNNQLQLYYQPLIEAQSGKIIGMEALIRWPHPKYGFISPMRFIPIAEQTGLIIPIGDWVIREACTQTRKWHEMGFNQLKVAVNLSEKQLRQGNLIDVIKRVLVDTKFDPHFLELEITETAILEDSITAVIKEFNALGISLAVDDFGTGYSGLSYLKRFAVDKLKIDQSFIRDIPDNYDSVTIVSAILAMAKELKIHTLAEGVETEVQLDFLKSKGCDYIQGYYFSKPLEVSFFTQYLMKSKEMMEV